MVKFIYLWVHMTDGGVKIMLYAIYGSTANSQQPKLRAVYVRVVYTPQAGQTLCLCIRILLRQGSSSSLAHSTLNQHTITKKSVSRITPQAPALAPAHLLQLLTVLVRTCTEPLYVHGDSH